MASSNFINECKTPAYEDRLGKIVIDGVEYNQGNYLTNLEIDNSIYNNGTIIGNTYTKGLKFSLININKDTELVGKKAIPSVGVKYDNDTTEYIDFDEFTIEALNDEQTKNFTDITGYDSLNILDTKYESDLDEGSHTIGEYWIDLVEKLGLETETSTFTNSTIVIPSNPFVNNESYRTVLSEIEKVSCSFCKVEKRTRTVNNQEEVYHVINLKWFDDYYDKETITINESATISDVYKSESVELLGDTSQATSILPAVATLPNPDYPQDIHVVSGDNSINVCGKNLFDKDNANYVNGWIDGTTMRLNTINGNRMFYIPCKPNTTYTISRSVITSSFRTTTYDNAPFPTVTGSNVDYTVSSVLKNNSGTTLTITTGANAKYLVVHYGKIEDTNLNETLATIMVVKGNTAPTTYEPYQSQSYPISLGVENLLQNNLTSGTNNGITYAVNEDKSVTLNGTATAITWLILNSSVTLEAGTYTMTSGYSGNDVRVYSTGLGVYTLNGQRTVTKTSSVSGDVAINIPSGTICNNLTIKPMIEKGSKANSYTPYGTTPIELCKIGDYQDSIKKSTGKNLCNGINQNVYLNNMTNQCGVADNNSGLYIQVSGGNYTISTTKTQGRYRVACSNNEPRGGAQTAYVGKNKDNTSNSITIDTTGYSYLIVNATDLSAIQIEKGSSSSDFEPYGTSWYLNKQIGKVVLNGSENWAYDSPRTRFFSTIYSTDTMLRGQGLCNYYKYGDSIRNGCFDINSDKKTLYIFTPNRSITSASDFKTWLSTHNTVVYYALANPTYTEITDTELIEELDSIKLQKGLNNISLVGDITPELKINYKSDVPNYEFETSDYSTLEGSLTKYGPVNCVLLGNENISGENVYLQDDESITQNGETKVLIDAEYFLYTQALREQAIQGVYDKLNNFEYYDLSLTTYYGKPFLEVGNKIRVNTNEGNVYDTFILQHTFTYDGTFKSVIKSPALTKQENIVKSTESISSRVNRTEIMVDKANGEITSITSRTKYLEDNTYTIEQTNQLIQTAENGLINTFSEAGGNNILRNTGLWFSATTSEQTIFPSNDLFPSGELFTGNKVVYEFWEGNVSKKENDKAVNMVSLNLLAGYLSQEQKIPNGYYVVSFKYKKTNALANSKVKINDIEYPLTSVEDTDFTQIIEVSSQHINIQFYTDIDESCEIYDLMVNAGQTKLAYSQNQNETTTDTVKIGQGITITSSNTDTTFKANADGIRTIDKSGNELTKFTDVGMTTKRMIVDDDSQIVGTLWQEVGGQTWITRL